MEQNNLSEELIRKWHKDHVLGVGLDEFDIIFYDGEGIFIKDINGKEYLDFSSQTYNVNIGHKNKKVINAAIKQMNKLSFCSMLAMNEPKSKLARLFYEITNKSFIKTYTVSSGSEANESALKFARKIRKDKGSYKFMSFLGAYHGATYGAYSLTSQLFCKPVYTGADYYGTIHIHAPYCYRCIYGQKYPECNLECAKAIESFVIQEGADHYAAIIMEPIISQLGVVIPPIEFMQYIRDFTNKIGIVLIFDEVITGFGRTGKLFAYEHFNNIFPDIMTLGKGISSGYAAIAAMLISENLSKLDYYPYYHGFTMSGSPLANAIVYENIKIIIEEHLIENANRVGKYFLSKLKELENDFMIIGDCRGIGLLLALEIVNDKVGKIPNLESAKLVWKYCLSEGLLFHLCARGTNVTLQFTPPLITKEEHIDKAINILKKAFIQSR